MFPFKHASDPFRPFRFNEKRNKSDHHHHPCKAGDARNGTQPNDGLKGFEGKGIDPEKSECKGHETFDEQNHPNGLVLQIFAARPKDEKGKPDKEKSSDGADDGHGVVEGEDAGDRKLKISKHPKVVVQGRTYI